MRRGNVRTKNMPTKILAWEGGVGNGIWINKLENFHTEAAIEQVAVKKIGAEINKRESYGISHSGLRRLLQIRRRWRGRP